MGFGVIVHFRKINVCFDLSIFLLRYLWFRHFGSHFLLFFILSFNGCFLFSFICSRWNFLWLRFARFLDLCFLGIGRYCTCNLNLACHHLGWLLFLLFAQTSREWLLVRVVLNARLGMLKLSSGILNTDRFGSSAFLLRWSVQFRLFLVWSIWLLGRLWYSSLISILALDEACSPILWWLGCWLLFNLVGISFGGSWKRHFWNSLFAG